MNSSPTPTPSKSGQMDLAVGDRLLEESPVVKRHKRLPPSQGCSDDVDVSAFMASTDQSSSSESSDLQTTNTSLTTTETSFSSTTSDFVLSGDDEEDSVSSLGEPKELEQLLQSTSHTYDFHDEDNPNVSPTVFRNLRITYLLVTLVIMLADGLQGKLCVFVLRLCSLYSKY